MDMMMRWVGRGRGSSPYPQPEADTKPNDQEPLETKHSGEESLQANSVANLQADLQEREEEIRRVEVRHCQELQERDLIIEQLKHQLDRFREANQKLYKNHGILKSQIRTVQEGAFRSMKNRSWMPEEDRKIHDKFHKLEETLRMWAKRYAVAEIGALDSALSDTEKNMIVDQLEGYCIQDDWSSLVQRMTPGIRKRLPILFSQAMLAKDVSERVFCNAFFALPENDKNRVFPSGSQMDSLYQAMLQVDMGEAYIWRSQMLRILSAALTNAANDSLLSSWLRELSMDSASDFLRGPVRFLLKTPSNEADQEKRYNELYQLYQQAGRLSLSLWSHRAFLRCKALNDLRVYHGDGDTMTAHRLHHLDEEDGRLNGNNVLAVIQPAFVAYGNEDAEHYDKSKVWASATVLIDESV